MPKPIQRVKFTKAIARHTKIRDQNPSLGYICPGEPHERSPNASKFEDRSQEETDWQEQGAREAAWEIIFLDIGLRLDGLLCLELWDLIVSVLGNVSRVSDGSGQRDSDVHKRHKSQKKIDVMEDINSVSSNVQSARQEVLLYVF